MKQKIYSISKYDAQGNQIIISGNFVRYFKISKENSTENPNAGVSIPIITLSALIIDGVVILKYTKKKNPINKI